VLASLRAGAWHFKRERASEMEHRPAAGDDTTSLYLVMVIVCLTTALLFMGSPPSAALTADQINQMPLWGP
jgi:hypothetical protein